MNKKITKHYKINPPVCVNEGEGPIYSELEVIEDPVIRYQDSTHIDTDSDVLLVADDGEPNVPFRCDWWG